MVNESNDRTRERGEVEVCLSGMPRWWWWTARGGGGGGGGESIAGGGDGPDGNQSGLVRLEVKAEPQRREHLQGRVSSS